VGQWIITFASDPITFLILVNVFLLMVGCFMETIAAITILTPVLLPVAIKLGIDPVHFGLIMVLNLMIGLLTPPSAWCSTCSRAWRASPSRMPSGPARPGSSRSSSSFFSSHSSRDGAVAPPHPQRTRLLLGISVR
jgi:hypothetical protein